MRDVALFLVLCFSASYTLDLGLYVLGGLRSWSAFPLLLVRMFIPSAAAYLAATRILKVDPMAFGVKGASKRRYYAYALAYPFVIIGLGLVSVFLLGTAEITINPNLVIRNILKMAGMPHAEQQEIPQITHEILLTLLLVMVVAPFINSIPALGEEYGWRGYLLDRLLSKIGSIKALTIIGAIWGLWHTPLILMGYNYPNHPDAVGLAMFTAFTVLAGFFLGWLRIRSGSVFTSALCHGAINAYAGLGMAIAYSRDELLTVPLGLPALPAPAILALLVYSDLHRASKK